MARKTPKLEAVEFTNSIGQVIKPGDEVVIITSGYNHRVNNKKGVYLGKKGEGVSCRVTENHTHYRHKETGENVGFGWYTHGEKLDIPRMQSGLRYGTPEYTEAYAQYRQEYEEYQRKWQEKFAQYEAFKVPYYRNTTLQLNRIFKIDTSLAESGSLN